MAEVDVVRKVVGVKVELSVAEAIALVNTMERIGQVIDANDAERSPADSVDWEALCSQFLDEQGRGEASMLFHISRMIGPLIRYTSDYWQRHEWGGGDREPDAT